MIYSWSACREFVLPAAHNEEFTVTISSAVFGLREDTVLHMEENKGTWYFLQDENYGIYGIEGGLKPWDAARDEGKGGNLMMIDGANYTLDMRGERVAIVVRFKETSFTSYRKYLLGNVPEVTIGRNDDNVIRYKYTYEKNEYIGRQRISAPANQRPAGCGRSLACGSTLFDIASLKLSRSSILREEFHAGIDFALRAH